MKENSIIIDINNREDEENKSKPDANSIYEKNFKNFFNFSFKTSYTELKESKIININIIKSKISIFEYAQPNRYLSHNNYLLINELNKKYQDCSEPLFSDVDNVIKMPQPLFEGNSSKDFNILEQNKSFSDIFNSILINQSKISYIHDLNNKIYLQNLSPKKDYLPILDNNSKKCKNLNKSKTKESILLNHKRKRYINESKKKIKKTIVIISHDKNKNDAINQNKNSMNIKEEESDKQNKKIIFRLSKGEKIKKGIKGSKILNYNKIKKNPGRKKKNSGEVGTHNKFSKDNMMRKLKNKVMESARKLINKIIKIEAGNEFKHFREIRKIEGIYSQELNIKFNFWFYFQKLKTIFQFKMSSKYSKGDLNSNNRLISRIYSEEKKNQFPKTIKLLEMEFHQYYHYIFLGEKKNWYIDFDIKEKENKYELDYFLNNGVSKDNDYLKYKITISHLACKYELFFLKKNPRLSGIKKKEEKDEPDSKKIIKDITNEQFEIYKYKFINAGINYIPEMKNDLTKSLFENKFFFEKIPFPYLNFNTNSYLNNVIKTDKNEDNKIISENEENINKINKNNTVINNNKNNNNNKPINKINKINDNNQKNNKHKLFEVSKKLLFEIKKKKVNKCNNEPSIKPSSKNKSFCGLFKINNINTETNTKDEDSKQKTEKETKIENIIQEDSSQNIEIVI